MTRAGADAPEVPAYEVGQRLVHHSGAVWEVVANELPGVGEWEDGMVAVAGDYRIRCVSLTRYANRHERVGREMRVHPDYLHGDGWRRLSEEAAERECVKPDSPNSVSEGAVQ